MTTSPPLSPPRLVAPATRPDRPSFAPHPAVVEASRCMEVMAPHPAVVEASRCMEVMARVTGGFVVDWELGGPTREQQ